jgi:outer membrane protein assembly factor BamB
LTVFGESDSVVPLEAHPDDWTGYRGNDSRSDRTRVAFPEKVSLKWKTSPGKNDLLAAPVAAGGLVFVADRNGVVRALNAASGKSVWENFTAGPVYYPPAISLDRLFAGSADGKVYAFEAKTGRLLWTFRSGPKTELIPVFGKLVSSWPVAGGVAVQNDTVYAAAGITHYDGTYVVALDARSGELKAHNTTSGILSSEVDSGISLQGNLKIVDGELQFLGGGIYETARYDLKTLACLNAPKVQVTSQYRTAFYPYYPEYNQYVSLEHRFADGRVLNHDANYEGLYFNNLALLESAPSVQKDAAGEFIRMQGRRRGKNAPPKPKVFWQDTTNRRFTGFILHESGDKLLAAGHPDEKPEEAFLVLIDVESGQDLWIERLPAPAVKGGTAIDAKGRIFAVLENGEVRCYEPQMDSD